MAYFGRENISTISGVRDITLCIETLLNKCAFQNRSALASERDRKKKKIIETTKLFSSLFIKEMAAKRGQF